MRAILYLRQSLDKQGDALGIARQEAECRQLCGERGWPVAAVIRENNVSATRGQRPGYREALETIARGEADVIVVWKLDRLLRRLTELEELIDRGVQVVTVSGDLDLTNASGRLIGRILASVARGEMETKSERHKLANAQKARAGKPHGSRRPYGYESDLVTIKDGEAEVLREMARQIIAFKSYKDVAWWANEQGHRTTTGRLWYPITVRNLLRKKRYVGIREYEGAEYPSIWPGIFDAVTWERLQLTIKLNLTRSPDRPRSRKYLLTGLVFCGKCGLPLNGSTKRDKAGRPLRRTYHCRVQGDTQRVRGCGGVVRNADALEHWVKEVLLYRLDSHVDLPGASAPTDQRELRALLDARMLQQQRLDALVDDYATGTLDRAQFTRAKTKAAEELDRLTHDVNSFRHVTLPIGATMREAWDLCDSDEWRRTVLNTVLDRIVVQPGITKPYYYVGDQRYRFDPNLIEFDWLA